MLGRALDDSFPAEVRRNITVLTVARLCANAAYRFSAPFIATVARGLDVSIADVGIALTIAELSGLLSPATARVVDRLGHRQAMVLGLIGVALGALLAALAPGIIVFAVAVVILSQTKVMFDLGLGTWISAYVPYERRSAVVGLTETSWALGLLLGVSTMGLTVAVFGWPAPYLLAAAAVGLMAVLVARRVAAPTVAIQRNRSHRRERLRLDSRGRWLVLGAFALMASTQSLFVTFGGWLQDDAGYGDVALAAVTFTLGFGELGASLLSSRRTDRWGKERSALWGAALMAPSALALSFATSSTALGLTLVIVTIVAFEFAIVSILAAGTTLVAGSPARGMALLITAGTFGRATVTWPATRMYESVGFAWPARLSAAMAAVAVLAFTFAQRRHRTLSTSRA